MNIYRSIGGRVDFSGVERVNRDGKMEVLKPDDVEVTPHERTTWYNKAKIDVRGSTPEEIYEVEKGNTHGNSMAVDVENRTMLPRKHQYSTEARLSEQRGEKPQFHKSDASIDNAVGVMTGQIVPDAADRKLFDEAGKTVTPGKAKKKDNPVGAETEASSTGKMTKGSREFRMASAFEKIACAICNKKDDSTEALSSSDIVKISDDTELPVEDVFLLERVAANNPDLVECYAHARDLDAGKRRLIRRKMRTPVVENDIPGNEDAAGQKIQHVSDPEQEKLCDSAKEVGLIP